MDPRLWSCGEVDAHQLLDQAKLGICVRRRSAQQVGVYRQRKAFELFQLKQLTSQVPTTLISPHFVSGGLVIDLEDSEYPIALRLLSASPEDSSSRSDGVCEGSWAMHGLSCLQEYPSCGIPR